MNNGFNAFQKNHYVSVFRFKVDVEPYPTIRRIVEELEKNEAFKASHPFNQPDCPEDLKQ